MVVIVRLASPWTFWPLPRCLQAEASVMASSCGKYERKRYLQFPLTVNRTDLHIDCWMEAVPAVQVTVRENGPKLRIEPLVFQCEKGWGGTFTAIQEVDVLGGGFPNGGWTGVITWFVVWPVLSLFFLCTYSRYQKLHRRINAHIYIFTGLFKMIVGCLTTCHTQYAWDSSICIYVHTLATKSFTVE